MKFFAAILSALAVTIAVAEPVRAVWNGHYEQVWTVTNLLVWKCGYTTGAGSTIYRLFRELPCPDSILVE